MKKSITKGVLVIVTLVGMLMALSFVLADPIAEGGSDSAYFTNNYSADYDDGELTINWASIENATSYGIVEWYWHSSYWKYISQVEDITATEYNLDLTREGTWRINVVGFNDTDDESRWLNDSYWPEIIIDLTDPVVAYSSGTEADHATVADTYVYVDTSVTEANEESINFTLYNSSGLVDSASYTDSTRSHNFTGVIGSDDYGEYSYNVTVTDLGGRTTTTDARSITLDTDTTDSSVTFSLGTEADENAVAQDYVFIELTVIETNVANVSYYLYNDSGLVDSITYDNNTEEYNFTGLADGTYEYNATVFDFSGSSDSTATRTIYLDTTDPVVSFDSGTLENDSNEHQDHIYVGVVVVEANEDNIENITFYLYNSSGLVDSATYTDSTREHNFSSLADDTYFINVTAVDVIGTSGSTQTRTIHLDTSFGAGTSGDPFRIINCTILQDVQDDLTVYYALKKDLDCSDTTNWNSGAGFIPIGNNTDYFTGDFDGDGHTISNLYINSSDSHVGLFGKMGGSVYDVGLIDVDISGVGYIGGITGEMTGASLINNSYTTGVIAGSSSRVGGLVGQYLASPEVYDSYSSASVSGTTWVGGLVGYSGDLYNSYATGTVTGTSYVGGLVGADPSTTVINNSYATGDVTSTGSHAGGLIGDSKGEIQNSYATGDVTSTGQYVGGLVGYNDKGDVESSFATGEVYSTGQDVGGLIGYHYQGAINDSYATGDTEGKKHVGGLTGWDYEGNITNSYATGDVTADAGNDGYVGGITGRSDYGQIRYVFVTGAINGNGTHTGGIIGYNDGSSHTELYWYNNSADDAVYCVGSNSVHACNADAQDNISYFFDDSNAPIDSWDFAVWDSVCDTYGYPSLAWEGVSDIRSCGAFSDVWTLDGNGSASEPFEITTCEQLQNMSVHLDVYYELASDVDCSDSEDWNSGVGFVPVGDSTDYFTGDFDGQGYTISDLFIDSSESRAGLFGSIDDASVENVGLVDMDVSGTSYVGGITGEMRGTSVINNTYTTGVIAGSSQRVGGLVGQYLSVPVLYNSYSSASVSGAGFVGGLAGYSGEAHNSYATGDVTSTGNYAGGFAGDTNPGIAIDNSYATGDVSGATYVGGFIGYANGNVTSSYATGDVTSTSQYVGGLIGYANGNVTSSYATGDVTGDYRVGGLIGEGDETVTSSYATGDVTAAYNRAGGLLGNGNGTEIYDSYSIGDVDADISIAGGLVGYHESGIIENSFATGSVTSAAYSGGLIGSDSSSTITNSYWLNNSDDADYCAGNNDSYDCNDDTGANVVYFFDVANEPETSWDFVNVWDSFCDDDGYPSLEWEGASVSTACLDWAVPSFTTLANQRVLYGNNLTYTVVATSDNEIEDYDLDDYTYFGINKSGYLTNHDDLSVGTYTLTVTAIDYAGHETSDTMTVTVYEASDDDDSSSSSSGSSGSPNFRITEEQLEEGYYRTMYEDWEFNWEFGGDTHLFKVEEVTETTATIAISSEVQRATLSIGEVERFDVDGDGYYDLSVKLEAIDIWADRLPRADFMIWAIYEKTLEEEEDEEEEERLREEREFETLITGEVIGDMDGKGSVWVWIVVLAIIGVIAWKVYDKKFGSKSKSFLRRADLAKR